MIHQLNNVIVIFTQILCVLQLSPIYKCGQYTEGGQYTDAISINDNSNPKAR